MTELTTRQETYLLALYNEVHGTSFGMLSQCKALSKVVRSGGHNASAVASGEINRLKAEIERRHAERDARPNQQQIAWALVGAHIFEPGDHSRDTRIHALYEAHLSDLTPNQVALLALLGQQRWIDQAAPQLATKVVQHRGGTTVERLARLPKGAIARLAKKNRPHPTPLDTGRVSPNTGT